MNIYDSRTIYHYECGYDFSIINYLGEEPHYFGKVPFVIFNLNEDNTSIFERVISLQDAYNTLLSDNVNDFEAFVDAYLVLKNVQADADDLAAMKESRTILIDGDDDVFYLTKESASSTQSVQTLLETLNSSIHTISNSPDFSSEEFNSGVSSGVALSYKLVGFNNIAANIEAHMRKALKERIELLNCIAALIDTAVYDVEIKFTHNLPTNIADTADTVNKLRGLVSDETLISLLPFVSDVAKEMDKIEEQNSGIADLYSFQLESTDNA